jgi:hypothetical protein
MTVITQDDIREYTAEEVAHIVHTAKSAAERASAEYLNNTLKGEDWMPCGFASVEIYGVRANSRAGKIFKAAGMRKTGGYWWWNNPGGLLVQNVDCKTAGADAAVRVLRDYGFTAYSVDRLD